jgi:hypothetical protein
MLSIGAQRLFNQQIEHPRLQHPVEILSWLGAIQGQDYSGAKWSLGLRSAGATDVEIEQAVADAVIVRTWLMRGTLHLVAGADVRWMTELVAPRMIANNARRYRQLELDEATLVRSEDILVKALESGKRLARKALFDIMEQNGISAKGQRGVFMLQRASLDGLIIQGVMESNNATFLRLDEAAPEAKTIPRDEALAELARRYFTSRGPATLQDFAWWSGLAMADARAGLEAAKTALIEETIDGERYWLAATTGLKAKSSPTAYAPPGFDEYLLGYKNRNAVLDPQFAQNVCPGGNGIFYPTIVIDGRMVGVWKRTFKKGKIIVNIAPFTSLSPAEETAFATAIARYGEFMQMPVEII